MPWTGIQAAYIAPAIAAAEAAGGSAQLGLQTGAVALYKATGIVFFAGELDCLLE